MLGMTVHALCASFPPQKPYNAGIDIPISPTRRLRPRVRLGNMLRHDAISKWRSRCSGPCLRRQSCSLPTAASSSGRAEGPWPPHRISLTAPRLHGPAVPSLAFKTRADSLCKMLTGCKLSRNVFQVRWKLRIRRQRGSKVKCRVSAPSFCFASQFLVSMKVKNLR